MALTKEERAEAGAKAAANWIAQRRADPAKMKKWLKAMQDGKRRKEREKKRAASHKKEATVAKKNGKLKHWTKDPKRAKAAALKGARTRKRLRREQERALAAREVQRNIVAEHSAEDLVHLEFPLVAGVPTRSTSGGHLGDDLTQLTPAVRKQLALEGLRFIKILLE
jgi:hypothetical protein